MFLKSILFLKSENFKNSFFALFWQLSRGLVKSQASVASSRINLGDLFASGRSSCEGYSEIFAAQLTGRPSSREKHLENFFTILSLSVLAACPSDLLATHPSREKRVFSISKTVFKTFSVFPSNFCDYSLSSPFLSQLKLTQTLLKLHFSIISSQIFKKRYGFSLSHFIFHILSLIFLFL